MITIKPAKLTHVITINELAHKIWPAVYKDILSAEQISYMMSLIYSPSSLKEQIADLRHKFIVMYKNKEPVGFASYSIKVNCNDIYRLHKIYVLQSLQGKGIV